MNPLWKSTLLTPQNMCVAYPRGFSFFDQRNLRPVPIYCTNLGPLYQCPPLIQQTKFSNFTPIKSFAGNETQSSFACQWPVFNSHVKIEGLKVEENDVIKKEEDQINSCNGNINLSIQVENMIRFFIEKFGKCDEIELNQQRSHYASNDSLLAVFENLVDKYSSSAKSREDMIKLILRKTFSSLRDSLRCKYNITAREASLELSKRYFRVKHENINIVKQETNEDSGEEIFDFFPLYGKKSKKKSLNMSFIIKIFSSETFCFDYVQYLSKFDSVFELDNQKKIAKFRDFLVECIENNMIHKLKSFTRVPWLKTWLRAMKVVAWELLNSNTLKTYQKKKKVKFSKKEKLVPLKAEHDDI